MTPLDAAVMKPHDRPCGDLARLGKAIAERQDALCDAEAQRAEAFSRLFEQTAKHRPQHTIGRRWLMAALAVCSLLVLLFTRPWRSTPRLTLTAGDDVDGIVGRPLVAAQQPRVLRFSDGSEIVLYPKTTARVSELVDGNATVVLEDGHLSARVVHNTNTRWQFLAGKYRVLVTGTAFDMYWSSRDGEFSLEMHEGGVLVTDLDGTEHRIAASTVHNRFPAGGDPPLPAPKKQHRPPSPTTSAQHGAATPTTSPAPSASAVPNDPVGMGSRNTAGRTAPSASATAAPTTAPTAASATSATRPLTPTPSVATSAKAPVPPLPVVPTSPGDIWGKLNREGKNK